MHRSPIHLDDLRWEPGNYGIARNNQLVANEVAEAGKADSWLMEGVYGWLANVVLHRATTLIWIDLPEEECIANVNDRGIQGGGSDEAFQELITWIAEYRLRNNLSCFAAHSKLFEAFTGSKFLLKSRSVISAYLYNLSQVS
ncbi:AAA family ATPase [Rhizobium sp. 18055]|uniref:AAA family ATPase n=1 Tax=Rhizobium sp. 18055 TaxID=2681403 RepID=UPI00135C3559|nr:AAA family ATPase [Rhizobium sp. 18055]